jgi:DNA-binding transcriptional MerR regulator
MTREPWRRPRPRDETDDGIGVTVGRLARRVGLSRSTLLYYDRIGLLTPSFGGRGAYRRYSDDDVRRLEQILELRAAGVRLADIKRILDVPGEGLAAVLERRLEELNTDIARLREQQRLIIGILKSDHLHARVGVMNRDTWVALLAASGFSHDDMRRWHAEFDRLAPQRHREFLEFLCIPADDIERIRAWALAGDD